METNGDARMGEDSSTGVGGDGVVGFEVAAGLRCDVRTASGNLRISEGQDSSCQVRMSTNDPDPQQRFSKVKSTYDAATNQLLVDTNPGQAITDAGAGIKKVWSRWIDNVRHDVDLELIVPAGASVKFRTASGDLRADVALDDLDIANASGDVSVSSVAGSLRCRSASGDVEAGNVGGGVECKTASGDVRLERVGGDVNIQGVSGDVSLTIDQPVAARINTVSGDVRVGVAAGLFIDVDANTVSGDLASEIPLDGDRGGSAEKALELKVRTVSGDVKIHRS
ncbi:MAG TPA: DUF4097 family beta strand repeat-containing protein [Acidimicrobiales bacterium]|nr:DUF4097 family beta strand repeat-containing protein [Acidimicrobiales bacterium]